MWACIQLPFELPESKSSLLREKKNAFPGSLKTCARLLHILRQ